MNKQYTKPQLRIRSIHSSNIIVTSVIPVDEIDVTTTDAPVRTQDSGWSDFENH